MVIALKPNNDGHFLSFSRKLFLSVISLFLVFAGCFIAYQYQREKEYKVELLDTQLQDYNERLQQELRSTPDSLWSAALDKYITKGSHKNLRVTIINLHGDVLYDSYNETFQEAFSNHINRQEIQKALKDGKGYDLRRTSETTGIPYFYSATLYPDYIIRSALPYNVNLINSLAADPHYLWFTAIVTLLLIFVFYKFTSKLGTAINHLREFAKRADKNEPVEPIYNPPFRTTNLARFPSTSYRYTDVCAKQKKRCTSNVKSSSPTCKPLAKDWECSPKTRRKFLSTTFSPNTATSFPTLTCRPQKRYSPSVSSRR